MQCRGQRHVTSISEWRDDETSRVSEIFITVLELCVGLTYNTIVDILQMTKYVEMTEFWIIDCELSVLMPSEYVQHVNAEYPM